MDELVALRGNRLPDRLRYLGFQPDDVTHFVRSARLALGEGELVSALRAAVRDLESAIGGHLDDTSRRRDDVFAGLLEIDRAREGFGPGTLAGLALVGASDSVQAWHAEHGVDDRVSRSTLADLGRRVSQHRQSFGQSGLEDASALLAHWQGSLYELGRLQFELARAPSGSRRRAALPEPLREQRWLLRIRIPQSGPLSGKAIDDSLAYARPFFAKHFSDRLEGDEPRYALCTSWLLDPHFAEVLPENSHVVRFQQRFTAFGTPSAANEDAVYFTFGRRGRSGRRPELDELPRDTVVQRVVLDRIRAGGTWQLVHGWLELP